MLEIRNTLEYMSLEKINLYKMKKKDLEELRLILEEMKKRITIYAYTQLNYEFHKCIVSMCGSQSIVEVYSRLGWPLLRTQFLSFSIGGNIEKSIEEHEKIMQLIETKNKPSLIKLLLEHNSYVVTSIQGLIHK